LEKLTLTYHVDGSSFSTAGEASSSLKMALKKLGLPPEVIRRAAICAYEGEMNMVIHARGGILTAEISMNEIVIRMEDKGPGVADIEKAMQEGYSTADETVRNLGFGAGMGLPNMKRYSDEMHIDTVLGEGTTVTVRINI
jgi:serine/threonine-protein kinase RsbT